MPVSKYLWGSAGHWLRNGCSRGGFGKKKQHALEVLNGNLELRYGGVSVQDAVK